MKGGWRERLQGLQSEKNRLEIQEASFCQKYIRLFEKPIILLLCFTMLTQLWSYRCCRIP